MTSIPPSRRRIFLECTRTWQSSLNTGIERVVRNLTTEAKQLAQKFGVECHPVIYHPMQGFIPLEAIENASILLSNSHPVRGKLKHQLEQWRLLPIVRSCKNRLHNAWFIVQSAFRGLASNTFQIGRDDVLVLLDSSWHIPYWKEVERAKANGATIGAVIYDMLPAQFPDTFTSEHLYHFQRWWNRVCQEADFMATISNSVLDHVNSYLDQQKIPRPIPGGAFRLGRNFTSSSTSSEPEPASRLVQRRFSKDIAPFYVSVGTFSPRKNQSFVLDAFESLWNSQRSANLVFVGSAGWHSEELIYRLRSHPEWGRRLFWFDDLRDEELNVFYQKACGLITASRGEGFNLPIVEALHHGCPVFASDIPVHREVGGAHAKYFSIGDSSKLNELLIPHFQRRDQHANVPPSPFIWPTWQESCEEFLTLIQSHVEKITHLKSSPRCA